MTELQPIALTGFNALSPQEQKAHREKIGVRARMILSGFWRDADMSDVEQAMECESWADVLENCSHSEIRYAWRDYQTDSRNRTQTGALRKPDAGALLLIIQRKRPKPKLVETPLDPSLAVTPPQDRVTPQRMDEIIAEVGLDMNPTRMPSPKRF